MKILYVNDDPIEGILRRALRDVGIKAEIVLAETESRAREFLSRADEFDVVLMDYDMDLGIRRNTVATGLVQAFVYAGFGVGKKPLVANSRTANPTLLNNGCSHQCYPILDGFVYLFETDLKK